MDLELLDPDLKAACFNFPASAHPVGAGPVQDCVVDKIDELQKELSTPGTAPAERLLALKYVPHFVGDVHQPLRSSDNQDRGGNCIHVPLGDQRTTNLHRYWDTAVLGKLGSDPVLIAKSLEARISASDAVSWSSGSARSWARESYNAAKASAYTLGSPTGCASDTAPVALTPAY